MKFLPPSPPLLPALVLVALLPMTLLAQINTEFLIKKIEPSMVESPQITASGYRKQTQGRPSQWLEVDVTFEREEVSGAPKFSDEVTVDFFILLNNAAHTADRKPTLLTGSTTLADIPFAKGLHSAAFVSPQALARFFDGKVPTTINQVVTDVGVTLSGSTGLAAIGSSKGTVDAKKGEGWWGAESDASKVAGRVLEKSQTPFAHLAWDYYQPSKSKAGN